MKMLLLAAWLLAASYPLPNVAEQNSSLTPRQGPAKPLLRFEDFKANSFYAGKPTKINYKSHIIARQYRTVITEGYKEERMVNFGGHYCLVGWGCGSPCVQFALVDRRTGRVYDGLVAPAGFDYKANSRLLLVNPPDDERTALYDLETEYWVWSETRHKFEQRFPRQ